MHLKQENKHTDSNNDLRVDHPNLYQALSQLSWSPHATNSWVMAWLGGAGLGSGIQSVSSHLPFDLVANQLSPKATQVLVQRTAKE